MADHLRKKIRDAAIGYLTGLTTTGGRVYAGRATPLPASGDPALLVDLGSEAIEAKSILGGAARLNERSLELVVRAALKAVSGYLDTLDTIALEVEKALAAQQTLGGLCKYVQPAAIDEPELNGDGEKTVAVMAIHFNVFYYSALNAPETAR